MNRDRRAREGEPGSAKQQCADRQVVVGLRCRQRVEAKSTEHGTSQAEEARQRGDDRQVDEIQDQVVATRKGPNKAEMTGCRKEERRGQEAEVHRGGKGRAPRPGEMSERRSQSEGKNDGIQKAIRAHMWTRPMRKARKRRAERPKANAKSTQPGTKTHPRSPVKADECRREPNRKVGGRPASEPDR